MLLAGYTSLVLLACYIPALRFLPGYDQDPLGAAFFLALQMWPGIGIIGLASFLATKLFRIPLLTSIPAILYPATLGLLTWASDSSSQGQLPAFIRRIPDDSIFWVNGALFFVAFVLILMGTRMFFIKWKK